MKKVMVNSAGGRFELREEPICEPGGGYVRVKVQACGICHTDALIKEGGWLQGDHKVLVMRLAL